MLSALVGLAVAVLAAGCGEHSFGSDVGPVFVEITDCRFQEGQSVLSNIRAVVSNNEATSHRVALWWDTASGPTQASTDTQAGAPELYPEVREGEPVIFRGTGLALASCDVVLVRIDGVDYEVRVIYESGYS